MTASVQPDEKAADQNRFGFALGVVCNGSLQLFHSQGMADVSAEAGYQGHGLSDRVHHQDFHRDAVMELWEQGFVDLDAPANDYLRAYQLVPANASWRSATIRHLLPTLPVSPSGCRAPGCCAGIMGRA